MEVGIVDSRQTNTDDAAIRPANIIDKNELFTYKHNRGEVISVDVGRLALCPVFAEMSEEDRVFAARQYSKGSAKLNEVNEIEQETEPETADETEESEANEEENTAGERTKEKQPEMALASGRQEGAVKAEQIENSQNTSSTEPLERQKHVSTITPENDSNSISSQAAEGTTAPAAEGSSGPMQTQRKTTVETKTPFIENTAEINGVKKAEETSTASVASSSNRQELKIPNTPVPEQEMTEQLIEVKWPAAVFEAKEATTALREFGPEEPTHIPDILEESIDSRIGSKPIAQVETQEPETETSRLETIDNEFTLSVEQEDIVQMPESVRLAEWAEDEEVDIFAVSPETAVMPASEASPLEFEPEFSRIETASELPAPIEDIEQVVLELSERIEELEPETSEVIHEILDAIVSKAERSQNVIETPTNHLASEIVLTEEAIEKDLRELFTNLFDKLEMDYTPELLESFTKLALKVDVSEFVSSIESSSEKSIDKGMHEAIKQLLTTISAMKRAILHAYQLGKSIMRLYAQQLAAP